MHDRVWIVRRENPGLGRQRMAVLAKANIDPDPSHACLTSSLEKEPACIATPPGRGG